MANNRIKKIADLIRAAALTCGARTKHDGEPCKSKPVSLTAGNGRCRHHGGLSTGPNTIEGIARHASSRYKAGQGNVEHHRLRRAAMI